MPRERENCNDEKKQEVFLSPPNFSRKLGVLECFSLWPDFVLKHSLRQKEGENVVLFIARCLKNFRQFYNEWEIFVNPSEALANFCLGGLRNNWLRDVIRNSEPALRNLGDLIVCYLDLLPYIEIARKRRRLNKRRLVCGLRKIKRAEIYPWE